MIYIVHYISVTSILDDDANTFIIPPHFYVNSPHIRMYAHVRKIIPLTNII